MQVAFRKIESDESTLDIAEWACNLCLCTSLSILVNTNLQERHSSTKADVLVDGR